MHTFTTFHAFRYDMKHFSLSGLFPYQFERYHTFADLSDNVYTIYLCAVFLVALVYLYFR